MILTRSNLQRKCLEILSDNYIWHNPESNINFLRPPRREVASGELGARGLEGHFLMCLGSESYIRCGLSVQKEDQPMEWMCLISSGTECPELSIFYANFNILRFFQ